MCTYSSPPSLPRQLVIGLHSVQSALIASNPFNPEPFSDSFRRFIFAGLNHSTLSHKLTSLLKRHLTRKLFHQTRTFLLHRTAQVPWAWHSTPTLFDALHCTPTKVIPPNCTLQFRLCSCGIIHGYLVSLTPIAPHSPLHVGDPVTQDSDFVLHFDGGAFRDLGVGGAGAILWLHNQGRLQLLSSNCIPLLPCIDAAYAEAAGAAYAVLLAGRHLPAHTPNKIIIKGDNRPVIDFMSNTGKYRRTDLQQLLEGAQHTLAFSLPHVIWSYTPREFNRCADYLAGVARDYARDAKHSSSSQASSLEPFPFSLPPSLATLYSPPSPLTLNMVSPSFTFPEVISLPTTHLPLVFQHAKHQPQVLKYLRALVQGTKYLPSLAITYRPTSPDRKGRLYPSPLGAQRLPRAIRTLLFGSSHYEIDLIGSHYQLFQKFALSLSLSPTNPPSVHSRLALPSPYRHGSPSFPRS